MTIYERAREKVLENKTRMESGLINSIPFGFPRLEKHIPGIIQGTYYLITANSGVGKSQLADHMFLHQPYEYINSNETDISLKIFYYSLEMSKEVKMIKNVCRKLFTDYNIITNPIEMQSYGKNTCSQELYDKFCECKDYFERMEDVVTYHDDGINPFGIYKEVEEYFNQNGTIHKTEEGYFDYYEPNNPNHYVIVIVDHLSLLTLEARDGPKNLHSTISKYSSNDCVKLRNRYGAIMVNVQQQSAESEKQQYTNSGSSIDEKIEPSLSDLGDCKLTQRDCNVAFGLFSPERYNISRWRNYDIARMKDCFRQISVLKSRDGLANLRAGLFFNGASGYFNELPSTGDLINLPKAYSYVDDQLKILRK